jgi:hypothetical protein
MTLTFDEVILRPLLNGLKSQALVAHAAQDDNGDRRTGGMDLSDGRETERIRERQVQEYGIKSFTAQKRESFSQRFRTGNLELVNAPFRKKILSELSVDVIVFDEERFDHLTSSLSRESLSRFLISRY